MNSNLLTNVFDEIRIIFMKMNLLTISLNENRFTFFIDFFEEQFC